MRVSFFLNKCNIAIHNCPTKGSEFLITKGCPAVAVERYCHAHCKTLPCFYFSDYYNNSGTNGGAGASGNLSGGPPASTATGSAQGPYGSYYQSDGAYIASSVAKAPKKKPPMHKGGKPPFPGPQGANTTSTGGYQSSSPSGQGSYNKYGQGYGQGKKGFNQNQENQEE